MTAAPNLLVDPELHATGDPFAVWRWMREHAPVYRHEAGELPAFWSLTRHADVRAVYRDPGLFSSAHGVLLRPVRSGADPGGGLTLALTDPPRHRALRSAMAEWFATRSVRALEGMMRSAVRSILDRAMEIGECDFVHDVVARLSHAVICRIIGVPDADQEDLFGWTNDAFHESASLAAHRQLMAYFIELMHRRMTDPTDDLMSLLVTCSIDGTLLTEEEILLNCENLLGATENGRLALVGGLHALLSHPGQWHRLRADRSLLPSAVEEILRWTSSATHSMRTATRATELHGVRIEAGDRVVVWIPSANRDERVFTDADRFDIARSPNRHLALGSGEHFCIGGVLARAETRILFGALLDRAGAISLAGPVVPLRSIAVRGPESLPVQITPAATRSERYVS
ncbi:cytochrome P450 [Actinophytocola sp.]|uniref:cytochrome P450 n=1 Tax=Actinophytocola sp. TaxID=1872138 RepID=UPI002D806BF8|nr:cytochrome P450 [Actinophytocola sp.]HET9138667.1 cytochrome P450 [Actinophytocola sp.]